MRQQSDSELFNAWRGGDQAAGESLFERHYDSVAWFFYNKAGAHAPDLVQQTFLACLESQDNIRDAAKFRPFLLGVARMVLLGHYRAQRRAPTPVDPHRQTAEDLSPSPVSVVSAHERQRVLLAALRRIPLDDQIILELRFWENMDTKSIATVVGRPYPTTRGCLRKALQRLRRALRLLVNFPEFVECTATGLETWARNVRATSR